MLYIKRLLTVLLSAVLLCGCGCVKENTNSESADLPEKSITVNGRVFTVEEIKKGIEYTFNYNLYYHDGFAHMKKEQILNNTLEYDLFYLPCKKKYDYVYYDKIFLILTNVPYPFPSGQEPEVCIKGININKRGMQSEFCNQGGICKEKPYSFLKSDDYDETAVFLGSHSIRIDEIKTPKHEQMDDAWKEVVKKEVQLYIDNSDTLAPEENWAPGKYNVYIRGFSESDDDTRIFFESENGDIYFATYYSIHFIAKHTDIKPANLSYRVLEQWPELGHHSFNQVRANAVLSFEVIKK